MKKILCAGLSLCMALSLAACGEKEPPADTTAAPETTTVHVTEETTIPQIDKTEPSEPPVTTIPTVAYRHPLNGEPLEKPWTGRATAVVINNIQDALPQHGLSEAEIVYEIETEGGITRRLGIFSDLSGIPKIGPVRSARTFFSSVAKSYDAPLVHCGGSSAALNGQYDDSGAQISNWEHINEMYYSSYFFRDRDRYDYQDYDWEHTLFTYGDGLNEALSDFAYDRINENGTTYGLQFDEAASVAGKPANQVIIKFRGDKTTTMDYQADTGLYRSSQYGAADYDANNDEPLEFKNVIVLYTDQWSIDDGTYYRSYYDLFGTGKGVLALNGQIVPIQWQRNTLDTPFSYQLEDGTPVSLGVGKTYISIVDSSKPVTAQ